MKQVEKKCLKDHNYYYFKVVEFNVELFLNKIVQHNFFLLNHSFCQLGIVYFSSRIMFMWKDKTKNCFSTIALPFSRILVYSDS